MKKFYFLSSVLCSAVITARAQSAKQVQWMYSANKNTDNTYEVHFTAAIGKGYHLYAQDAGAVGPLPITFTFVRNPLVIVKGKLKELGKLVKHYEKAWPGTVNYYEDNVDFVALVQIKGKIKTSLAGAVEFIVCNDRSCLPPSSVNFSVNVGG